MNVHPVLQVLKQRRVSYSTGKAKLKSGYQDRRSDNVTGANNLKNIRRHASTVSPDCKTSGDAEESTADCIDNEKLHIRAEILRKISKNSSEFLQVLKHR